MAFLGFLYAGEAQVIVIEQVTFDIIKALLSFEFESFTLLLSEIEHLLQI